MKHIYYFIGLCFILYELTWLYSPVKKTNESRRFYQLAKGKIDKSALSKKDESLMINKSITMIFYLLWFMVGLFTFNWPIFLAYLVFNFIIFGPIAILVRENWGYVVLNFVNSLIGLGLGIFVILNSYHFKFNIYEYIKTLWF